MAKQYGDYLRATDKSLIPQLIHELMQQVELVTKRLNVEYENLEDFKILTQYHEAGIYEGEFYPEFWTVAWKFTVEGDNDGKTV